MAQVQVPIAMLVAGFPVIDRGVVIVSPPRTDPPRRTAPVAGWGRGLLPLDAPTRAQLHEARWRRPRRERWRPPLALAVVGLLHLLFAGVVWFEMQPHAPPEWVHMRLDALQVRLIARAPAPRASVPPPRMPVPQRRPPPAREAPAADAMSAHLSSPAPTVPKLFDRNGQPLLPAVAASAPGAPGYVQRLPQGDAQVMRHASPLPYQATRFDAYFPPPKETLLGQGVRRALNRTRTNDTRTVNLPGGVHLQCKTLLGLPTPFCHDPPPPPSRKGGDERLSMAPATPLTEPLRPRALPGVARCIELYRTGHPLPHGCPVDTPNRAVDAELADCLAADRAGRSLPAHCPGDIARRDAHAASVPAPARSSGR